MVFRYLERTSTLQPIKPLGLCDLSNLQLRFLCPQDINEVIYIKFRFIGVDKAIIFLNQ